MTLANRTVRMRQAAERNTMRTPDTR
jgi:hypothetical protein